jgi:hypothetical protein
VTVRDLDDDGDAGTTGDGIHEGTDTLAGVAATTWRRHADLTKAVGCSTARSSRRHVHTPGGA